MQELRNSAASPLSEDDYRVLPWASNAKQWSYPCVLTAPALILILILKWHQRLQCRLRHFRDPCPSRPDCFPPCVDVQARAATTAVSGRGSVYANANDSSAPRAPNAAPHPATHGHYTRLWADGHLEAARGSFC